MKQKKYFEMLISCANFDIMSHSPGLSVLLVGGSSKSQSVTVQRNLIGSC
jgi:hypothetical protein